MDWFSWLSKSNLDPSLIYEYGHTFSRNELEKEDIPYFNHEFLQSMGISIAKHRLEILKLARKESGVTPHDVSLYKLFLKFNKTKRLVGKRLCKWLSNGDATIKAIPEPTTTTTTWHKEKWRGDLLRRHKSEKEHKDHTISNRMIVQKHMRPTLSGPLDVRMHDKMVLPNRGLKLSGPLDSRAYDRLTFSNKSPRLTGTVDGRIQDKVIYTNRSPRRLSGPVDGKLVSPKPYSHQSKGRMDDRADEGEYDLEDNSLWSVLFQDMKPT